MNIQDEMQKIHHKYGVSEMANYKIEQFVEKIIETDRAEQLKLHIVSESSPKDAILKVYLKADSGYTSNEEVRISPDQWGAIMKILHPQK
tara:strand:- start:909 stop:1178 length:270 start_codon:yes stop_codon:yes gene_type:complete